MSADEQDSGGLIDRVRHIFENYGWILLIVVCICAYIYKQYISGRFRRTISQHSTTSTSKKTDNSQLNERDAAMLAARMRMQERQNVLSDQAKLEAQKREEAERQAKLDALKRLRYATTDNSADSSNSQTTSKKKPSLRNADYNPLWGGGSGSSYRPSKRSCNTGGG